MNNMELETDIEALDMEMGEITIHYCPVIPNPEGEPTAELKTADIEGTIYEIVDEEARTELENKVDKVEGKDLSTNDYTDEDKAIVDGVTTALDGKVDKDGDKVLSDNNYSDEDKAIVDGVTEALNGKADKSDTYTKLEVDSALDNKVDKVEGKDLSENDFTDTLKDKLDGIEAEANKTIVDSAISPTSTNPVQNKVIYDLLNDILPEATETGNPISITNASGLNAKSLKVELEPIQDLNGYDSPWVGGGGKNKLQNKAQSGSSNGVTYTVNDGIISCSGNATATVEIEISSTVALTNDSYILNGCPSGGGGAKYKIDIPNAGYATDTGSGVTFTANDSTQYRIRIVIYAGYGDGLVFKPMIRISSVADDTFAPYSNICPISGRTQTVVSVNSEDTTIPFNQTVYGGEVDVTSGGTSDKFAKVDMGSIVWTTPDNTGLTYSTRITDFKQYGTGTIHYANAVCDNYKFLQSTITEYATASLYYHTGYSGYRFFVKDSNLIGKTATQVATYMSGKYICYELATPTTISTPSNEISLLKGANTIVADGDMELVYSKTPQ